MTWKIKTHQFRRNPSLQAVHETPVARVTGCVSSLGSYRSAAPLRTAAVVPEGQQGDFNQTENGNSESRSRGGTKPDGGGTLYILYDAKVTFFFLTGGAGA